MADFHPLCFAFIILHLIMFFVFIMVFFIKTLSLEFTNRFCYCLLEGLYEWRIVIP